MMQDLLVGLIVVAATLYAAWRLPGTATRVRVLEFLLRHSSPDGFASAPLRALRDRQRLAMGGSGCGACGSNPAVKNPGLRQKP